MITERKLSIHFFTNFVSSSPGSFMNGSLSYSTYESCVWYVSKYHTYIHNDTSLWVGSNLCNRCECERTVIRQALLPIQWEELKTDWTFHLLLLDPVCEFLFFPFQYPVYPAYTCCYNCINLQQLFCYTCCYNCNNSFQPNLPRFFPHLDPSRSQ